MRQKLGQAAPWQVQYQYLLALFQNNCAANQSLGIAAGGVAVRISEVSPPDNTGGLPAIGIQFARRTNAPTAQRVRIQQNTFEIVAEVEAGFSETSNADIYRATKLAIENLFNDQNGHGIEPLLCSDLTLGGTAIMSIDTDMQFAIGDSDDAGAATSGRCFITFVATAEQQFS